VTKITCRFAGPADIPALVQLRLDFLTEGGQDVARARWLPRALRAYFSKNLASGAFIAAIAETAGVIVATGGMIYHRIPPSVKNPTGLSAYIMNVYVMPEFRRRGLATKLLKMLAARAKKAGCISVQLHFWKGRRALYAKAGYLPVKTEMKLKL
jgi:GNAT superfamily N-acetyltransferase